MVDGQPWIPNGTGGFGGSPGINGGYNVSKHIVDLRLYKDDRTTINLYLKNVVVAGRYSLNRDTYPSPTVLNPENYGLYSIDGKMISDTDYNYITNSQHVGFVDFTVVDTITTQLSGTFEFEGIDFPSGKKIKITNGRFDLNQTKR